MNSANSIFTGALTGLPNGQPDGHPVASDEAFFQGNPTRVLRLLVLETEHGHLDSATGLPRRNVPGLSPNATVYVVARVLAPRNPGGTTVTYHAVSDAALIGMRLGDHAADLSGCDHDALALVLLEYEVLLDNTSAKNLLRQMLVPAAAIVPEPWRDWFRPLA